MQQNRRPLWPALSFAVIFAALGTYLLLVSHAAIVPLQPSVTWKGTGNGVLTNVNSGLCLSAPGTSKNSNGTQLLLATCDTTQTNRNEYWSFLFNQNYTLENGYNQCLNDTNSSKVSGAPAQIWSCTAASGTQQWVVSSSDKTIRINGLCLGVSGNATSSGSLAVLMDCNAPVASGGTGGTQGGGTTTGSGGGSADPGSADSQDSDDSGSSGSSSDSSSDTGGGSLDTSGSGSGTFDFGSGSFALGGSSASFGSSDTGSLTGGSSSTFDDKNVDKNPGHSGGSLKNTIGAIFVVFALAVAGTVVVLWLRRKEHNAWENRGGDATARKALLIDSPPPPLPPEIANKLAGIPAPPEVPDRKPEHTASPTPPAASAPPAPAASDPDDIPDMFAEGKKRLDSEEREIHFRH